MIRHSRAHLSFLACRLLLGLLLLLFLVAEGHFHSLRDHQQLLLPPLLICNVGQQLLCGPQLLCCCGCIKPHH
jgi:hypothetical protein